MCKHPACAGVTGCTLLYTRERAPWYGRVFNGIIATLGFLLRVDV